jgi:hypothetical protein
MPDFGIFRGFNDKLFGDKLYAGQLPINLGLIGSTDFSGTDSDALAFFARVTAAGGTLSANEQTAVNTLVVQMKLDGIWTKMKAIYPFVGASAAACAQNLKSSSFTGSFSGGWTFSSTGVKGNGSSGYMQTGLNPNLEGINETFGIYSRTFQSGVKIPMGVIQSNAESYLGMGFSRMQVRGSAGNAAGTTLTTIGFILMRDEDNSVNQFSNINNVNFSDTRTFRGSPNNTFFLGAANQGGSPNFYSDIEISTAFISDRLSSSEASNFYTAVQAFQTTLSRNV